ncbi:5'-3' exonuclease [Kineococcus rubinsiae]|uniref:5'-3' exonuclease n=1 Tax=Kineococcus rubinsiae TaxID=2609562 RepID=UPI001431EB0C|nr:5'-3' exonuclease [Kineococcus rubinsiae]
MLLDSASLYFRAFHGVPDSLTAPDGTPVNAVRGFLDSIAYLLTQHRPTHLVACWDDDWRPAFRVEALPSYKAHRVAADGGEDAPDALGPQVPVIVDVLAALGIARVGCPGFEADDVMATLATRAAARGSDVDVVTGDRDLFQLVSDADAGGPAVQVLYVGRGVRKLEVVDLAWLRAKYDVDSGQAYADMAVLRGDPSDGLPGVAGIGEKTAVGLLRRFGDLAGVQAAAQDPASDLSGGQRTKLLDAAGYLAAAPLVVRTVREAPVAEVEGLVPTQPADVDALGELVHRWGVQSSVERVLVALASLR